MSLEDTEIESGAALESAVEELPVLTVRETVIYPGALLPVTVGRPSSLASMWPSSRSALAA